MGHLVLPRGLRLEYNTYKKNKKPTFVQNSWATPTQKNIYMYFEKFHNSRPAKGKG